MVHVEMDEWLHDNLCRLKPKARSYWNNYHGLEKRKGKVSIQEVITYLYYNQRP